MSECQVIANMTELQCLGTTLTWQSTMHEEMESSLSWGSACCHLLQSRLYSVPFDI